LLCVALLPKHTSHAVLCCAVLCRACATHSRPLFWYLCMLAHGSVLCYAMLSCAVLCRAVPCSAVLCCATHSMLSSWCYVCLLVTDYRWCAAVHTSFQFQSVTVVVWFSVLAIIVRVLTFKQRAWDTGSCIFWSCCMVKSEKCGCLAAAMSRLMSV